MIVELENIELHKLSKIIESKGGKVLELKTDAIRFFIDGELPFKMIDEINIDGYFGIVIHQNINLNIKEGYQLK